MVPALQVRITAHRAFRFIYSFLLVTFFAWALQGYLEAAQGYEVTWRNSPQVDPISIPPYSPLILIECRVEKDQLIVRLLRTYAVPEAEELLLLVELYNLRGEATRMKVRTRVPLGSRVSLAFPLWFDEEQLSGYRVEVYINGKLVAARLGGRTW